MFQQVNQENTRNEQNYINHYKTWLNLFFPDQSRAISFNWFVMNQNQVLLTLLNGRNERNNSIETLRKEFKNENTNNYRSSKRNID